MEPTSGNTGISLAMICRRGYKLVAVMPDNVTEERTPAAAHVRGGDRLHRGGQVRLQRRGRGGAGAGRGGRALFMPFQYGNPANPRAHYEGTAEEIVGDCPEVDVFVGGLGTGGTLMGYGRRLKEHRPEIQIVAVRADAGRAGERPAQARRRLRPADPRHLLLDRKMLVANRDAILLDPPAARRGGDLRRASPRGRSPASPSGSPAS